MGIHNTAKEPFVSMQICILMSYIFVSAFAFLYVNVAFESPYQKHRTIPAT